VDYYYVVLGIAEDASEETIRSAFRALARRFHPDVGGGSSPVEFQRAPTDVSLRDFIAAVGSAEEAHGAVSAAAVAGGLGRTSTES
jgi:curved DNA-binding protein CbpA